MKIKILVWSKLETKKHYDNYTIFTSLMREYDLKKYLVERKSITKDHFYCNGYDVQDNPEYFCFKVPRHHKENFLMRYNYFRNNYIIYTHYFIENL
jgi:hypothetical protein